MFLRQRALPFRGQLIDTAAAAIDFGPSTGDQSRAFEPVERRIQRAFSQINERIAFRPQRLGDRIPMPWRLRDDGQQQEIEVALQRF